VSCGFSRAQLALHAEGDLSGAAADTASRHLVSCADCRRFFEQLHVSQSLLKSLRRETASPSQCTGMRREVMSIIEGRRNEGGWALQVERAITLGLRRHSYALAALVLLGVVSVPILGQILHTTAETKRSSAIFEGRDTLLRPEGYRDWILVGPSSERDAGVGLAASSTPAPASSVYINPSGYREYLKTGRFPEGTLMVWEARQHDPQTADRPHDTSPVLLASVKDSSRFDGGWGFFDFTGTEGEATSKALALPESSGCRNCHRREADTDHVFTQVYPVLRSARRGAQLALPEERARLTALLAWSRSLRFPQPALVAHA
jgi:hypothetical protein